MKKHEKTEITTVTENIIDVDFEEVSTHAIREAAIAHLEGKFPYSRERYLIETKYYLQRAEESFIEAGKMFLVMKEREAHGEFAKILEEHFPRYSHRTVNKFMGAALMYEEHPTLALKIKEVDMSKSSVFELMAVPDEELKELEEKGIMAGYEMDEIAKMTVKEVRELARKLKNEKEKEIAEGVKQLMQGHQATIANLEAENQHLREQLPSSLITDERVIENLKEMKEQVSSLADSVNAFKVPDTLTDPFTMNTITGLIQDMEFRIETLKEHWDHYLEQNWNNQD